MTYFKVFAPRPESGRGRFALNILSCLITLCITVSSAAAQSGVLLGLYASHFDDANEIESKPPAEFRDLWIASNGKQIDSMEIPALMVPRGDGWWRMGASKSCKAACKGAFTESEDLWIVPGVLPPAPKLQNSCGRFEKRLQANGKGYELTGQGYEMLRFVSPEWISWTDYSHDHEPCQYRGFQWSSTYGAGMINDFVKPPADENAKKAVAFSDAVGEDQSAAFQKAINDKIPSDPKEREDSNCQESVDAGEDQWTIERDTGAWRAIAHWDSPTCPLAGQVDFELPANITGRNTLAIQWSELTKQIPGVTDAASSPGNDLLIAQMPSEIRVYTVSKGKIGPVLKAIPLDRKEYQVVMIEWATGRSVARWTQQLAAYKSQLTAKTR